MGKKPAFFGRSLKPTEFSSKMFLGDHWLIGAITTLTEQPNLLEKLFVNKTYNEEGVYRVRLCKNGEWQQVTVDDYIPWIQDSPAFT